MAIMAFATSYGQQCTPTTTLTYSAYDARGYLGINHTLDDCSGFPSRREIWYQMTEEYHAIIRCVNPIRTESLNSMPLSITITVSETGSSGDFDIRHRENILIERNKHYTFEHRDEHCDPIPLELVYGGSPPISYTILNSNTIITTRSDETAFMWAVLRHEDGTSVWRRFWLNHP